MNITLNIVAGSSAELQEAINGLASQVVVTGIAPKVEPLKTKKEVKPVVQPDKDPDPVVESGTTDAPPEETDETVPVPTIVELRATAAAKGASAGKAKVKALLDKFESKSISDVPEDKRAAFMQALEEL